MILTGNEIKKQVSESNIKISDFSNERINPNSYNYRLGKELKIFTGTDSLGNQIFEEVTIPEEGFVLEPGAMYLGVTEEVIGSSKYAMSLIGRSSLGRYGLFLQVSANLGHTTSCHRWTLEIYACKKIKVYPLMNIGQVSFWDNYGEVTCFGKTYANFNLPTETVEK